MGSASMPSASAASPPPLGDLPDSGPPHHVPLDPSTRRKMKMPARRSPAPNIAFGKHRLGILSEDAFVVRDAEKLDAVLHFSMEHPRAIATLADGSLLAAGSTKTFRLMPHDEKPRTMSRLLLLPSSALFGDRRAVDRFWVLPGMGKTLYGYDAVLGASLVAPAEWIELDGFDHRSVVSVRDGSFVYTTEHGVMQFYGAHQKTPLEGDVRSAIRLVPGSRPDTIWAVSTKDARLQRLLAGKLYPLKTVNLEQPAFDAAASEDVLAVLELAEPDDAPWSFVLEVFDIGGARRFRVDLPAEESLGEGWETRLARDRGLAVSEAPVRVAVGGPGHLDVFDGKTGSKVFSAP
jgi:hypothetical protein